VPVREGVRSQRDQQAKSGYADAYPKKPPDRSACAADQKRQAANNEADHHDADGHPGDRAPVVGRVRARSRAGLVGGSHCTPPGRPAGHHGCVLHSCLILRRRVAGGCVTNGVAFGVVRHSAAPPAYLVNVPNIVARPGNLPAPRPSVGVAIMLIAAPRRVQAGACHRSVGSARSAISPTMAVKEWSDRSARSATNVPAIIDKVLRAGEGKILRRLQRIAEQVNSIEADYEALTDAELRSLTDDFKERCADGEALADLMPEAFAAVREAAKRAVGRRHLEVKLRGGPALHLANIAEMKPGEGKPLTAVLAAYLNALTGEGVHIVTVNDYLAKRDAEWMGRIHRFLGLEVGVILAQMTPEERRKAYSADITYGTNNEFGFDYLRDNMAWTLDDRVQRWHHYRTVAGGD